MSLFGAKPPKGQEMDDHYFGSINEKVSKFMKDENYIKRWLSKRVQRSKISI